MPKQKVYKYRSLGPWEYFLDILVNKRLYTAHYKSLNDPMEGLFTYSTDENLNFIQQLSGKKTQLRICSLSKVHDSTVMWSYYASSHKGVVFGLEIDSDTPEIDHIEPVEYVEENKFRGFLGSDAFTEARKILSKKNPAWIHEKEIRIFSRSTFVPAAIRQIYLGCQMSEDQQKLVKNLALKIDENIVVSQICRDELDANI